MSQTIGITIKGFDQASDVVAQAAEKITGGLRQVEEGGRKVKESQDSIAKSSADLVKGLSGLATSAFALYAGFDQLQTVQLSADKANLTVQRSTEAAKNAQDAYNQAIVKYGADSPQAEEAARKLEIAQEALRLALEKAEIAQGNVNQRTMSFALTVVPTMVTMADSAFKATEGLSKGFSGIGSAVAANPLGLILTALAVLIPLLIAAYENCEPFRNAVNTLGGAMMSVLGPAVDDISKGLTWLWENVVLPASAAFRTFWDVITSNPILAALFGPITTVAYLIQHWSEVTGALSVVWSSVTSVVSGAWNTYVAPIAKFIAGYFISTWNSFMAILSAVKGAWDSLCGGVAAVWNTVVQPLVDVVMGFANAIHGAFKLLFGWLIGGSVWTDLCSGIVGSWMNTVQPLLGTVSGFVSGIVSAFQGLSSAVSSIFVGIASTVSSALSGAVSAVSSFVSGAQSAISGVYDQIGQAGSAVSGFVSGAVAQIGDWLSDAADAVAQAVTPPAAPAPIAATSPAWVPPPAAPETPVAGFADEEDFWMHQLMWMQHGGVVTRPTPALLGEAGPEAVIPLERVLDSSTIVHINSPLVYVAGAADRRTVDAAVKKALDVLRQGMIVEASSVSAPLTSKNIRKLHSRTAI